jgi:hypothetical protein
MPGLPPRGQDAGMHRVLRVVLCGIHGSDSSDFASPAFLLAIVVLRSLPPDECRAEDARRDPHGCRTNPH